MKRGHLWWPSRDRRNSLGEGVEERCHRQGDEHMHGQSSPTGSRGSAHGEKLGVWERRTWETWLDREARPDQQGWLKLLYRLGFRNGRGQAKGKDALCVLRRSLVAVRRLDRGSEDGAGASPGGDGEDAGGTAAVSPWGSCGD